MTRSNGAETRLLRGRAKSTTPILRRAAAMAVVCACVWAATPFAWALGSIASVQSTAGSDYTRIVIEVGQATRYNYGSVQADPAKGLPPRLYIDLHDVRIGKSTKHDLWVGDTRVRQVRTGQYTGSRTRLVLDLEGPVTPKVFTLTTPPRIVIELRDRAGEAVARGPGSAAKTTKPAAPARTEKAPEKVASSATVPKKPVASIGKALTTSYPPVRSAAASKRQRVVIDAGHGGRDPGAKGYQGAAEKDAVFDISKRVAEKLSSRLGVEVVMTRASDKYLTLETRKDVANRVEADLFVSIHANASDNKKLHGIETYYLKNSNDRATLRLAKLENGVDMLIKGRDISADADLPYILSDMVQGQKEADSILLANHIQDELVGYLNPRYHSVRSLGVKQGPFMVLDGTYMPSVLVEVGFITHSLEGRRLTIAAYQDAVAEGLYRGLKRYLSDSRVAQLR